MEELEKYLSEQRGHRESVPVEKEVTVLKRQTYSEYGYIHQEWKKSLGYLTQMKSDTVNGIIIGVDCCSANRRKSDIVLEH